MGFRLRARVGAAAVVAMVASLGVGVGAVGHASAPTVSNVSPNSGSTEGGTTNIVITGTGFYNGGSSSAVSQLSWGTVVVFSTDTCTTPLPSKSGCFTVNSDTQITATSPPHRGGPVHIVVTVAGVASTPTTTTADQFTFNAPTPVAAQLDVHSGTAGTKVTISPGNGVSPDLDGYDFPESVDFLRSGTVVASIPKGNACPTNGRGSPPTLGCFSENNDILTMYPPAVPAVDLGVPLDVVVTTLGGSSPPQASDQFTFYRSIDTVEGYGGVHPVSGTNYLQVSPDASGDGFGTFNIARAITVVPGSTNSGYILDGWGGIHPFGGTPGGRGGGWWTGWDIARGIQVVGDGVSGYVLDGWGGLHGWGTHPPTNVAAIWPGWDIARGFVVRADGVSGYILDGWGGVHAFGGAPPVTITGYWSGWDIARGIALDPTGNSGYVLDGFGGLHPFFVTGGSAAEQPQNPGWRGWDIARGVTFTGDSASGNYGGYILDGFGGLHPFNGAPTVSYTGYRASDIFRGVASS